MLELRPAGDVALKRPRFVAGPAVGHDADREELAAGAVDEILDQRTTEHLAGAFARGLERADRLAPGRRLMEGLLARPRELAPLGLVAAPVEQLITLLRRTFQPADSTCRPDLLANRG